MGTQRETLRLMSKSIISRLENDRAIVFSSRLRHVIVDEVFELVHGAILTDEDLKEKALEKIGIYKQDLAKAVDKDFSQDEQFKAARVIVKESFGQDMLSGFYFQRSPKAVSEMITAYLMRSSHIDDVFEADADLQKKMISIFKNFNPAHKH